MATQPKKSQKPYKGYPPPLPPEDERVRQLLKRDKVVARAALKLWSESVDDKRKTDGPSETELIAVVKANFSAKIRPA